MLQAVELTKSELTRTTATALYHLTRASLAAALAPAGATEEQITAAAGGTVEYFSETLFNPNGAARRGARSALQEYYHRKVTLITDEMDSIVGYSASADNVSGRWVERQFKRWFRPDKVYRAIEFFSTPDLPPVERQAIGSLAVGAALYGTRPTQNVTAYSYSPEYEEMDLLEELGFHETGRVPATQFFGTNTSIEQVRMEGRSGEILTSIPAYAPTLP